MGKHQVFSKTPFQKKHSREFIDAVKYGDYDLVEYMVKFSNRYLVYDFDYVINRFFSKRYLFLYYWVSVVSLNGSPLGSKERES